MHDILVELLRSVEHGRPVAYCRLVETRGSTPQKAGACMLVHPDGSQAGTLGGGCVEAEVKRRALIILDQGVAEIVAFQLDSDYGWDDGLICGGRMQVLVQPVRDATQADYFRQLCAALEARTGCTEAVVFDAEKSDLTAPSCYLFGAEGELLARDLGALERQTQGQADVPPGILARLPDMSRRPKPFAHEGISYLPQLPRCRLLIVGGGHVGQAVGNLAADLDFDVWVVDDRADIVSPQRFPRARRRIHGDIGETLKTLEITRDTYCLIVTRGHNHDEEALFHLADRGARYVGMIGSKRKIKLIFDDLESEGIPRSVLSQVHAPVGLEIGSQTVMEIAVSILAELIAHRNLGKDLRADCDSLAPLV